MAKNKGFTLLELIIVVIIIGILAGYAMPGYFKTIEKARAGEAKNLLGALRGAQIRYYAVFGTYTNAVANLDVNFTATPYFFNPEAVAGIPCSSLTKCVGSMQRNSNPGIGQYTAAIEENGTIIFYGCDPSAACVSLY